uniref:Uncharacterized protein n=1 Tax=Romanomermis culicivorax TaxID=13658 RepID=A0A915I704_ROMCU
MVNHPTTHRHAFLYIKRYNLIKRAVRPGLFPRTIGFFACYLFVRKIYKSVHITSLKIRYSENLS